MQTAQRFSKQRQTILDEIRAVKTHPTAEAVYEMTKKKIPNISLGTVYRNLSLMKENGQVLTFTIGGKERFDGNVEPHIHMCCEKCMAIEDIFFDKAIFHNTFLKDSEFSLDNVVVTGICRKCKESKYEEV